MKYIYFLSIIVLFSCKKADCVCPEIAVKTDSTLNTTQIKDTIEVEYKVVTNAGWYRLSYSVFDRLDSQGEIVLKRITDTITTGNYLVKFTSYTFKENKKTNYEVFLNTYDGATSSTVETVLHISVYKKKEEVKYLYRPNNGQITNFIYLDY